MKNLTKTILLAAVLISGALFTPRAHAGLITGNIAFLGSASSSGASGAGNTTVSFTNPWSVVASDGSYAGTNGTATTFSNFTFHGDGTSAVLNASVVPLWTFTIGPTTYSFDLTALTSGHTQSGSMAFTGSGTAHITGFQDTFATWALSGSAASGFNFTISTSETSAAPDGGSALALLGIAMTGVEVLRRKFRRA